MGPPPDSHVVRLRLAPGTDVDLLRRLHAEGLSTLLPAEWGDLVRDLDARQLRGVYPLTEADLAEDVYGFAREFQLVLGGRVPPTTVLARLRELSGVESAEPLHFEHPS